MSWFQNNSTKNDSILKEAIKIEKNGYEYENVEINDFYFSYSDKCSMGSCPLYMLKEETKQFLKNNGYNHLSFER